MARSETEHNARAVGVREFLLFTWLLASATNAFPLMSFTVARHGRSDMRHLDRPGRVGRRAPGNGIGGRRRFEVAVQVMHLHDTDRGRRPNHTILCYAGIYAIGSSPRVPLWSLPLSLLSRTTPFSSAFILWAARAHLLWGKMGQHAQEGVRAAAIVRPLAAAQRIAQMRKQSLSLQGVTIAGKEYNRLFLSGDGQGPSAQPRADIYWTDGLAKRSEQAHERDGERAHRT